MSVVDFVLVLIFVGVLAMVVLAANVADRKRQPLMVWFVIGTVILVNIVFVANSGLVLLSAHDDDVAVVGSDSPSEAAAATGLVAAVIIASLATAFLLRPVRERIARVFPDYRGKPKHALSDEDAPTPEAPTRAMPSPLSQESGKPLFPQMLNYYTENSTVVPSNMPMPKDDVGGEAAAGEATGYYLRGFNPASYVHMLAVVLVLYVLGSQMIDFVVSGGMEGLAQTYEEQGVNVWTLLSNAVPFVVLSFLGVGLGIRRDWHQTLKRLGLGRVTWETFGISLGVTFALFMGVIIIGMLWMLVVSPELYKEQTQASEAMSASVTSVGLALMIAATAAIGEEIAFRGALQPVIGFWPTAIAFALTHTQYTLTPAWLMIFGVAIAFGWIRRRYNTSVAILTHFWYNLFQLLLLFVMPEETTESILRLFS